MDFGRVHPFVWFAAGAAALTAFIAMAAYAILHEMTGSPF